MLEVGARAHPVRRSHERRRELDGDGARVHRLGARADVPAGALSHGERRALELAMALAARPRALLLDEPLAGMGREDSARMIRLLAALKGQLGILLIEHDMDAVFALADRVTVLADGRVIATGTPDAVRRDPIARAAYLGEEEIAPC